MLMTPMRARLLAHKLAQKTLRKREQEFMRENDPSRANYGPKGTSIPVEVKGCKFDYKPIDYTREKELRTEDEIIDSVLNPNKKFVVKKTDVDVIAPEVVEYWHKRAKESEVRRGRLFHKIT